MKSRKFKSFLFLVVLFTAITFSCDDSMPEPIYGTKPTVAFTAAQSASDIYTWSFTNSSSGAISYNWDFGDGNGSSDANPSHTYAGPGCLRMMGKQKPKDLRRVGSSRERQAKFLVR
jgi:hypothetical protein